MSTNLDRFNIGFKQAIARNKNKATQAIVQAAHPAQKMNNNVVTTAKSTSFKLGDEQYRVRIINLAIAHIKMKWSI